MLEVQDLSKSFGTLQALKGLSLRVQPGEIFGFVGSNGADKTTVMRIMLGVPSTGSGRVSWSGKEIDDDVRRKVSYIPEECGLYPKMQVRGQLEYFVRLHGPGKVRATRATEQWTDRLGVADRRNDNVQKLSLDSRQRIQLATVLVRDPIILVLDGPFSGLDPVTVGVTSQVLEGKARSGAPIIFSPHQLNLVERSCDRIGIVPRGSIVAEDTIHELRNAGRPQIVLTVPAGPDRVHVALASAGVRPQPDPLEGASDTPSADELTRVIVDAEEVDNQVLLRATLSAGPVYEFAPRRPYLAGLFKGVVVTVQPEEPTQKSRRGIFGYRKDAAR